MGLKATSSFPLGELASVSAGMTQRGAGRSLVRVEQGPHYLRIGDISKRGEIRIERVLPVSVKESAVRRYLVREGDIVMANRGGRFTAAIVPRGMIAVASGQLIVVKGLAKKVRKEYVHWYINLKVTQDFLRTLSRGNRVRTLSMAVLKKELVVPVPSILIQERIVEIVRLTAREGHLSGELRMLRSQWIEGVLLDAAR